MLLYVQGAGRGDPWFPGATPPRFPQGRKKIVAEQKKIGAARAKQSKHSIAKQGIAKHSIAKHSKAEQSKA